MKIKIGRLMIAVLLVSSIPASVVSAMDAEPEISTTIEESDVFLIEESDSIEPEQMVSPESNSSSNMPTAAASEVNIAEGIAGDNITWYLDNNYVLHIQGSGAMYESDNSGAVPWSSYNSKILSVEIEEGITTIQTFAFCRCTKLTEITLPDTVISIGIGAFDSCSSLEKITIPQSVTSIGHSAFCGCKSLKKIDIPDSITSISSYTFESCTSLTEVNIPDSVTYIGIWAFQDCTSLTSVYIPDSVTNIDYGAFVNCSSLVSVHIPEYIDAIGDSAFDHCTSLSEINIPDTVTMIGGAALYGSSLTEVYIPKAVTSIGISAFCDCTKLTDVYYAGTKYEWNQIAIDENNKDLLNATIHYSQRENPFTDVQETDYFYDSVQWANEYGITSGVTETLFAPNQNCTRQQAVMFLWRYAGQPDPAIIINPFTDVDSSSPFCKAILWAVEKGITSGKTATTFDPNSTCTRQQIAMFLWRYSGKPTHSITSNPFTDVSRNSTFYDPIMWVVENSITLGNTVTTYAPINTCTRAQIVTFLYRMNNLA